MGPPLQELRRPCRLGGLLRRPGRAPPAAAGAAGAAGRPSGQHAGNDAGGEEVAAGHGLPMFQGDNLRGYLISDYLESSNNSNYHSDPLRSNNYPYHYH